MKHIFVAIIIIIVTIYFVFNEFQAKMAITFFPIDENVSITNATTSLVATDPTIEWKVTSISSEPVYLRQDVALLFQNGYLKGVLNKWQQHVTTLEQREMISLPDNSYLQAIAFHYGENQRDEIINSLHKMSTDELYCINNACVKDGNDATLQQLQNNINATLENYWTNLMKHFRIDEQKYIKVPLTDIEQFERAPISQKSMEETKKIIGQFWEGLYKNYIIPSIELKNSDMMPLVLLAKESSHLIVLFTLNGNEQILIQHIA